MSSHMSFGYPEDPRRIEQAHQPATMAAQLRVLCKEKKAPASGTK
ncbi:hypothetical protein [Streptomyces sp. NPDC059165]